MGLTPNWFAIAPLFHFNIISLLLLLLLLLLLMFLLLLLPLPFFLVCHLIHSTSALDRFAVANLSRWKIAFLITISSICRYVSSANCWSCRLFFGFFFSSVFFKYAEIFPKIIGMAWPIIWRLWDHKCDWSQLIYIQVCRVRWIMRLWV